MVAKFLVTLAWRNELPGCVMPVLVKNRATAGPERPGDFLHQQVRIGNETEHPTASAEIERFAGQIVVHQIELVNFDIGKRTRSSRVFDRVYEIG